MATEIKNSRRKTTISPKFRETMFQPAFDNDLVHYPEPDVRVTVAPQTDVRWDEIRFAQGAM